MYVFSRGGGMAEVMVELGTRGAQADFTAFVLSVLQYGYCRIDGNTGGDDREYMIDEFNKPDSSK